MLPAFRAYKQFIAALVSVAALAALALLSGGDPAPAQVPTRVRLMNPVEITINNVHVDALAILPDNETVVVVGGKPPGPAEKNFVTEDADPAGVIVNLRTKVVRSFTNGHTARIKSVAVAGDGSRIFTVCSNKDPFVRVWDVKTSKPLAPIRLPQKEDDFVGTYEVASCASSRQLVVNLRWCLMVLDPDQPDQGKRWYPYPEPECNLVLSPNGKLFAYSTIAGQVVIKDLTDLETVYAPSLLPLGGDYRDWSLYELAFSQDGTQLIAVRSRHGDEGEVPQGTAEEKVPPQQRGLFLIDVGKKHVIPLGLGHQIYTLASAFHPSGDWIATVGTSRPDKRGQKDASDRVGELRIHHFRSRSTSVRVQFYDEFFPHRVRFTPDGKKIVAVDYEGKVKSWDFTIAGEK